MKKILFILLIILISLPNVMSYKDGETITYSVVCLTNEGKKDDGCAFPDDDILDPQDTTAKEPTTALAEVSDANFPGLWRGNYTLSSPNTGTWAIYIELSNSNGTTGATVLNFEVTEGSLNDVDNILADTNNLDSNFSTIQSNFSTIAEDTNELQTDLTNGGRLDLLIDGIKADTDNLDSNFSAIGSNFSNIINYVDSVESNQATLAAQLTQNTTAITENATKERTNLLTYLADTIYAWLITDENVVQDSELSTNTTAMMVNSSTERSTILSDTNAILVDTGTTIPAQLTQNTTAIMINATAERTNLLTYLVDTIYAWLTTDENIVQDSELSANTTAVMINATTERSTILEDTNAILVDTGNTLPDQITQNTSAIDTGTATISAGDIKNIANEVWNHSTGYVNPDGSKLNANESLKQIAENTEAGGW